MAMSSEAGAVATGGQAVGDGGGLSKRGWKVSILVLALASLVTAIDLTIIAVALPTVEDELGLSPAAGQWVVNAYLISFTLLLIPGGMFGDRIGQIRGLNVGLVIFAIGSVMCGAAGDEKPPVSHRSAHLGTGRRHPIDLAREGVDAPRSFH